MVGVIGCRCVACGPVRTQMVVNAGEGKEIRKKKGKKKENRLYSVQMTDAIGCGRVACARAVVADKGTKKRKETHQVRMVDAIACGRVACAWAVDADEGKEKRKK